MQVNLEIKAAKVKLFTTLVKQFPLAFKAVAKRSMIGHEKYADIDQDWQGFTVTPVEEYQNAIVRHLMLDGEERETELDHLSAVAWNALALLELKLRDVETKRLEKVY